MTASDDYYSLSSSDSSHDDRGNIQRYETPPLHTKSREKIYNEKYPETANPTVRIVPHAPLPNDEKPANEKMDQGHQIKRKPISKESPLAQRLNGDAIVSPPTPGFDDTPYIQFALEQLTRDEEVNEALHSRMRNAPSTDSYPVERLLPEEILRQQRRQSKGPPPPIDDRERDSESNGEDLDPIVLGQKSDKVSKNSQYCCACRFTRQFISTPKPELPSQTSSTFFPGSSSNLLPINGGCHDFF